MTKKNVEIRNWKTDEVIYKSKAETLKECVEEAVSKGVNLSCSNLRGVNLRGADLSESDLRGSDFENAKFK